MSGFSTHLAHALMNHVFRGTEYVPPASSYLALFIADPTDDNLTANEVSAAWYARQQVSSWTAPAGGTSSNSNTISYNAVTDNAVTITHWGLYDAATSGNLLASGAFNTSKVLNIDDVFVVGENDLVLNWE